MDSTKLQQRFWATTKEVPGGCVAWLGPYSKDGYGWFSVEGKRKLAHRVSLKWKLGREIRDGFWALHSCNNKFCVKQAHLYEGTPTQNMLDQYNAGVGRMKLSLEQRASLVGEIEGGAKAAEVCRKYGVKRNYYSDHKRLVKKGKRK